MSLTEADVRTLLLAACAEPLSAFALGPDDVTDDFDLREHGIVDSLGFLEILADLELRLGHPVDLEGMEPADLTVVGPLVRHLAAQAAAPAPADRPAAFDLDKLGEGRR